MTTLHILNISGDTEVLIEENVELATELFQKALANGGMAYTVGTDVQEKEVIRDLGEIKEDTQQVVVRGPMAGG